MAAGRHRWTAERATPYLVVLARHLEHRRGTTSLAWWELPEATPRGYRAVAPGLVVGPMIGLATAVVVGFASGLAIGVVTGAAIGLVTWLATTLGGALLVGPYTAWGRLGQARIWLAARRRQPLRLLGFPTDAHDRGVLRQAGAVGEFRHANLQRHLAGPP